MMIKREMGTWQDLKIKAARSGASHRQDAVPKLILQRLLLVPVKCVGHQLQPKSQDPDGCSEVV